MLKGIDSPEDCTGHAQEIKTSGAQFVGRYYRHHGSHWPPLIHSEVEALHAAKLQVVAMWEAASDHAGYFSHAAGVDDATSAYRQALQAGQTPGSPIYFAVDYDAQNEIAGAIDDYFVALQTGFAAIGRQAPAFKIGVYGSGRTCAWLLAHGRVTHTWLALSTGWSGFATFKAWNIKQGKGTGSIARNHDDDNAIQVGGF